MKTILTQLSPNNQLKVRYVRRHSSLKARSKGDSACVQREERLHGCIKKVEEIDIMLRSNAKTMPHSNTLFADGSLRPQYPPSTEQLRTIAPVAVRLDAICSTLPKMVEVATVNDEGCSIERIDTDELRATKRSLLDIIAKSQQGKSKSRTWGEKQSVKTFTSAAKQKILEAGAVVERQTDLGSQYELTLTIPGSGYRVYDSVSRWSGWLVNRLCQVIRRWQQKGCEIYWFFVWEHQKRGALHSHWCIAIPGQPMLADFLCRLLKGKWFQLLKELSELEGIDLFARKGFQKSWIDRPDVWQWSISPVRKSVAAYFSKYCSKNVDTSAFNLKTRQDGKNPSTEAYKHRRISKFASLCPSRYWGASSSIKKLCKSLTVTIPFEVDSAEEAFFILSAVKELSKNVAEPICCKDREFLVACKKTRFVYCEGWEETLWFPREAYDSLYRVFSRLRAFPSRKEDLLGGLLECLYSF